MQLQRRIEDYLGSMDQARPVLVYATAEGRGVFYGERISHPRLGQMAFRLLYQIWKRAGDTVSPEELREHTQCLTFDTQKSHIQKLRQALRKASRGFSSDLRDEAERFIRKLVIVRTRTFRLGVEPGLIAFDDKP